MQQFLEDNQTTNRRAVVYWIYLNSYQNKLIKGAGSVSQDRIAGTRLIDKLTFSLLDKPNPLSPRVALLALLQAEQPVITTNNNFMVDNFIVVAMVLY